jgi:hypothetical protein
MSNTGYKIFTDLEEYDELTGNATGNTKPNVDSDPDYIPPTEDTQACPIDVGAPFIKNPTDGFEYPYGTNITIEVGYYGKNSIVTDNLVVYLDPGNGMSYSGSGTNVEDLTAYDNDGVMTGGVTYESTDGGRFSFDGDNDYIRITNGPFNVGSGDFTIEAFAYYTGSSYGGIFASGDTNGGNGIILAKDKFWLGHSGGGSIITYSMPLNQWLHVVGVKSGNDLKLYVNDVMVGNLTTATVNPVMTTGDIGSRYTNSKSYDMMGYIGLFRFYTTALSEAQITNNFNASKGRFGL